MNEDMGLNKLKEWSNSKRTTRRRRKAAAFATPINDNTIATPSVVNEIMKVQKQEESMLEKTRNERTSGKEANG